jgi:hypothetical protein
MELVDGKTDQKQQIEVIMGALENLDMGDNENLAFLTTRMAHPNTSTVQINNTIFIYNSKQFDNENEAVCYPFSIEVRPRYATNLYDFIAVMQKRGFTKLTFLTADPEFLRGVIKITPTLNKYGTKTVVGYNEIKDVTIGRVGIGKKKLEPYGVA